jgi:hypothetical protein
MKRMIPALLLLALTVACVKQPAAPSVSVGRTESFPTVPSIVETPIGSDEVPLQPIETIASSPVPATDNPTSAPEPDPTEPPAPAIDYTTYRSVPLDAPLSYPITVREVNWEALNAGKQYDTTFRSETVDFRNFRYAIEDFRSDETGTQFTIRLYLPEEWTDLQCLSMNPYFGFRFYLDDKPQNDFRLADQSVIFGTALAETRCDSFTMTYRSDAVSETVMHAAHEWTIVPFFLYRIFFAGSIYNDSPGGVTDLTKGDVCRFNGTEDAYWAGKIGVTELSELSLSLPIEHIEAAPAPDPEPRMLQVSVWTEDVERNKKEGKYGSDGRLKDGTGTVYGTYQNVTVDFSRFEIHIERFYYWEHGFFMILRCDYPEEWPQEIRQSIRIDYRVYADGEPFGEPTKKEGHVRSYFKGASATHSGGYPEYKTPIGSETYSVYDQKNFSFLNPFPVKELTFKFYLEYFPTLSDLHEKKYDLTNGEPFYVDRFMSEDVEKVPLFEITIPTDQLVYQKGGTK